MHARFFTRPIASSFVCGFLGGVASGQGHAVLETNANNRNSWALRSAPGIVAFMGIGMAIMDPDFHMRDLTDHALVTVIGFCLGFCAGRTMMPAAALTSPKV